MSRVLLKTTCISVALIVIAELMSSTPIRAEDASLQGGTMYAAFRCWGYAAAAGEQDAAERLFKVGLRAGHDYLNAAREGKVDKERPGIPLLVQLLMEGPTNDFILGRLFQHLSSEASDRAWGKIDDLGIPTAPDRWGDQTLRAARARTLLARENCNFIR